MRSVARRVCPATPAHPGAPGKNGANGKDGATGKDGANGNDGANGKDGKDGVTGWERVVGAYSAYTVGPRTVTATCTAGKKVVGGGFEVGRAGQPHRVLVLGNLPSAEDTWSVVARSWGNQNNRSFEIRAYALCVIA